MRNIDKMMSRPLLARAPEVALCLLAVAERAYWAVSQPTAGAMGEAMNVAVALGQGRGFAGAYGSGHGLTAHLLPLGPAFAGLIYAVLPPRSPMAEAILAIWSIGLTVATYFLIYQSFVYLCIPRWARLIALAVGMLAPAYLTIETVDFRVWEGGLAAFLAALFLNVLLATNRHLDPLSREQRAFPLGLVASASLLFFVNPPLGLAAFACLAVMGLKLMPMRANVIGAAVAILLVAVAVVPWTIRNYRALGAFVPLRSNAGLELDLANSSDMVAMTGQATMDDRLRAIHPTASVRARAEVIRIGEVAYARRRGAEAKAWIADHPVTAALLWMRHIRQMLIPDRWMTDSHHTRSGAIRALFIQSVGVFGLLSLALLIVRRGPEGAIYVAVMLLVPAVVLAPFQPVSRYTYVLYPTLCMLCSALSLVVGRKFNRSSTF